MRTVFLAILLTTLHPLSFSQVTIKMKSDGGVSTLPCKVNGLKLQFIFDTGASNVSISLTEATFMLKNDYLSASDIVGKSKFQDATGKISEGVNIILREVEIGGLILHNVEATVVNNIKAPLLLGQSAISKLGVVQLDLQANTLTILARQDSLPSNADSGLVRVDSVQSGVPVADSVLLRVRMNEAIDNARYVEAIAVADQLIAKNYNVREAYLIKGLAYDGLADYRNAILAYNQYIQLYPSDDLGYFSRGRSKFDQHDYAGAITDFTKGLSLNNKFVAGYSWRAQAKEKLGDGQDGLKDYDKAIALAPNDSSLYVERARLRYVLKDYTGAISDCNKALVISTDMARAYYFRGSSKFQLRDYRGALTDFNQSIDLDPEYAMAYVQRGFVQEQFGELKAALADYDRALVINPELSLASSFKETVEKKMEKDVWISAATAGDDVVWYIHKTPVSKNTYAIKTWVKRTAGSYTTTINGRKTTVKNGYQLWLIEFNCSEKEYQTLSIHHYDANGKLLDTTEFGVYAEWKTVVPQSVMEAVHTAICERYN